MMMEGIGLEMGSGALESLREELAKKKEPKRLALSVGEQAIETSGRIIGGKLELQKLLKIFLDKDQLDKLDLSIFLLRKDEQALQILAKQRFLAEIKVA